MKGSRAAVVIASTILAAGVGAGSTWVGHSDFGFLPLVGLGHLLLGLTGLAAQTRVGTAPRFLLLLLFNTAGYGILGLLGGLGFVYARRSRVSRLVLGMVVGTFAGVVLLAGSFHLRFLPSAFVGPAMLVVAVSVFFVAPVLGVLTARKFSPPSLPASPRPRANGMHWFWRGLIAVVLGYSAQQAVWSVYFWMTYPGATPSSYWQAIVSRRLLIVLPLSLALLALTIWVFAVLTRRYGPRPDYERETLCRRCGYNLRGISEPRCPECGERI